PDGSCFGPSCSFPATKSRRVAWRSTPPPTPFPPHPVNSPACEFIAEANRNPDASRRVTVALGLRLRRARRDLADQVRRLRGAAERDGCAGLDEPSRRLGQ